MTTTSTITLGTCTPTHLEPFHGFEQVLEGDPAAGVAWLRTSGTSDATLYAGIFTVQPSRFRYAFDHDECIHVLEGEVEIAVDGDATVELRAGDLASFGAGPPRPWTRPAPQRKFFVISG